MRAHALPTDFHLQLFRYFLTYFEALTKKNQKSQVVCCAYVYFALFSFGGGRYGFNKRRNKSIEKKKKVLLLRRRRPARSQTRTRLAIKAGHIDLRPLPLTSFSHRDAAVAVLNPIWGVKLERAGI